MSGRRLASRAAPPRDVQYLASLRCQTSEPFTAVVQRIANIIQAAPIDTLESVSRDNRPALTRSRPGRLFPWPPGPYQNRLPRAPLHSPAVRHIPPPIVCFPDYFFPAHERSHY